MPTKKTIDNDFRFLNFKKLLLLNLEKDLNMKESEKKIYLKSLEKETSSFENESDFKKAKHFTKKSCQLATRLPLNEKLKLQEEGIHAKVHIFVRTFYRNARFRIVFLRYCLIMKLKDLIKIRLKIIEKLAKNPDFEFIFKADFKDNTNKHDCKKMEQKFFKTILEIFHHTLMSSYIYQYEQEIIFYYVRVFLSYISISDLVRYFMLIYDEDKSLFLSFKLFDEELDFYDIPRIFTEFAKDLDDLKICETCNKNPLTLRQAFITCTHCQVVKNRTFLY